MDLSMTQRYMHLSPAALGAAIRLLEEPSGSGSRDIASQLRLKAAAEQIPAEAGHYEQPERYWQ